MRAGVRVALDLGAKRIGVARCDRDGILAVPVTTIDASAPAWIDAVRAVVAESSPIELIVGNPVSLRGRDELASQAVRERVAAIAEALPGMPIRLVDERLSTASAMRQLRDIGKSTKDARGIIDVQAAIGILEFALESERRTGQAPGELL